MPYLRLPNGKYEEVPEGVSYADAYNRAKEMFPKLYADEKKAEEGFIPSVKSGFESLKSAYSTAAAPLFGLSDDATKRGIERSQAKRMETAKAPSWEDVQKAQEKYGLFGGEKPEDRGGLSSLLGMWRGQIGESLPQMGAVAGGARLGALAGLALGPVGTIGGGALGALAASYPAFVGTNVERQVDENEKAKEIKPLDYRSAATAAAPQAALDVAETAFVLGRLGVGKLFASALPKLGIEKAEAELVKTAERSLAKTVGRGAATGVAVEMPTETAQAVLERWQAGLSLFDADARKEYVATAVGVVGPGALFGGVGGVSGRSAARDQLQELQQTRDAQAAQQQAALQQQQQAAEAAQAQQAQQARAAQQQAAIEAPQAVGPQGRLFEGEASALPVQQSMQQLYTQIRDAEAQGDTQTASALRNDFNRLSEQLKDPEALQQQRDALQEKSDALTTQMQQVAAVNPVAAQALYQQSLTVDNQIKQFDKLLKQAPLPVSDKQAQALQKQYDAAAQAGDRQKMLAIGAKLAPYNAQVDTTGDLLAGVPLTKGTTEKERAVKRAEMEKGFTAFQTRLGPQAEENINAERIAAAADRKEAFKTKLSEQLNNLGFEQGTQQAQQLLEDPLKMVVVGTGKTSLGAARAYQQIDTALNDQQITPQVANIFGIKVPDNKALDLKNTDDAETALPVLNAKIKSLEEFRKRVFPNKELIQNGHLTPAGNRFVRMEAVLHELNELRDAAQTTLQQTPAEDMLTKAPLGKEVNETSKQRQVVEAQVAANKSAEERKNAMFELGNLIELLRQGKTNTTIKNEGAYEEEGKALIDTIVNAAGTEVDARLASLGKLQKTEKNVSRAFDQNPRKTVVLGKLRKALNNLLLRAKPKPDSARQAAARERIAAIDAQIAKMVPKNATKKQIAKMVQEGAIKEQIEPLILEERKLRLLLGTEIKRGMTKLGGPGELSKPVNQRKISELAKLQAGVDSLVENLVGKQQPKTGNKQAGAFDLVQESFAQAQGRAEDKDSRTQAVNRIDDALAEPVMSPEVRQTLRDAKDFLETSVYGPTSTKQNVIDEAFTLADRVVMGREANPKQLQEALATAQQYVGEGAGQKEMFAETRSTTRTTPARFERFRKAQAFNYKQNQAEEAKAKRDRIKAENKNKKEPEKGQNTFAEREKEIEKEWRDKTTQINAIREEKLTEIKNKPSRKKAERVLNAALVKQVTKEWADSLDAASAERKRKLQALKIEQEQQEKAPAETTSLESNLKTQQIIKGRLEEKIEVLKSKYNAAHTTFEQELKNLNLKIEMLEEYKTPKFKEWLQQSAFEGFFDDFANFDAEASQIVDSALKGFKSSEFKAWLKQAVFEGYFNELTKTNKTLSAKDALASVKTPKFKSWLEQAKLEGFFSDVKKVDAKIADIVAKTEKTVGKEQAYIKNFAIPELKKSYEAPFKKYKEAILKEQFILESIERYIDKLKTEEQVTRLSKQLDVIETRVDALGSTVEKQQETLANKIAANFEPYVISTRTFETTLVNVKNAAPGTELGKYESSIKRLNKAIKSVGKALKINVSNIELNDADALQLKALGLSDTLNRTDYQLKAAALFSKLVNKRTNLQQRMTMPVRTEKAPKIEALTPKEERQTRIEDIRDTLEVELKDKWVALTPQEQGKLVRERLIQQQLAETYATTLPARYNTALKEYEGASAAVDQATARRESLEKQLAGLDKKLKNKKLSADNLKLLTAQRYNIRSAMVKLPAGLKRWTARLEAATAALDNVKALAKANKIVLSNRKLSVATENKLQKDIRTAYAITERESATGVTGIRTYAKTGISNETKAPGPVTTTKRGGKKRTDYREATPQDRGVDSKAAADVVARVKKALPKDINFVYAPTMADVPQSMRDAMAEDGVTYAKGAVLPDGTVVVIGEAHKSTADLEETIAHELIGHYGVDTVLGPERMQALVDRLFKQGDKHVADVATALNVFPDVETALAAKDLLKNPEIRMMVVREMIAHAAEGRRVAPTFTEQVKGLIRDMVAAVRSLFRNMGLSDMAKRDAKEIQALIRESSRSLAAGQLGAYVSPDGTIAFRGKEGLRPAGMSVESWDIMHSVVAQDRSKIDEIRGNITGLAGMTQFVDRYAPIWAALEKGVAGKKITDLEASQVRYNLSARDKIMNFTRLVAANGALEYKQKGTGANKYWMVETKNKDGANLVKVFKALGESGLAEKDAGDMFTMYMAAQRVKNEKIGVDKLNFGKDKNGNQMLTEAKLQQFEREIAAMPRVKTAFDKARGIYNEYNKGLVDFAEQAGALSKEKADALRATKDYIPFYRENPSGEIELILGNESSPIIVGNLADQPHLHGLVGGDTAISNIFTSAVQNTNLLTDMALRNIATGSVVDTLRKLGMLETREYKDKQTGEQKESIKVSGMYKGVNVIRFRKDGEDIAVRVETKDTMFDGIPPTLLVKGLEGVKTTMPKALELMGLPAQFLRRAVILSPLYPLRQVVKDSFSALGTSGANFIPVVDPFKNIYKSLTGTSREAALLESQGLLGGQVLAGGSKEALSTVLRSVVSGKQSISGLLAFAEAKSMEADVGVRLSAYNSYIKQGLNEMEAWVAANEITDFNRRGVSPSIQWANTLYPFFNAQIQGMSVFIKAMTGKMPYNERLKIQEKFKQRAMAMAAFTVMYAMAMEDDEAYKNATPEQKLNNWFVRVPFFDEPLKIPIPFEFGLLAKAIPEAIYNSVAGDDDVSDIGKALVQMGINSIPGGSSKAIPQFLVPVVEGVTGKDLFTGADVESSRMQSLDPAQRYKDTTTELAKTLGSMGIPGVSPVKVDQFIRGVGAQTLLSAVSLADAFFASSAAKEAEKKTSQTAFIGSAFQPNDAGGIINRTYELMQDGERAVNTYKKLNDDGKTAEADAYLNANLQRISIGETYPEFKNNMKQIADDVAQVKASDLVPSEKRKRLDQLRKDQIDIAKQYREIIRKAA
jgi:hypothetical protein